jgi:hypothetical protein
LRRQDFHVPSQETQTPNERHLSIDVRLALPELEKDEDDHSPVPEFFNQFAVDNDGRLKCRIRLQAKWTADGSVDGSIDFDLGQIAEFSLGLLAYDF